MANEPGAITPEGQVPIAAPSAPAPVAVPPAAPTTPAEPTPPVATTPVAPSATAELDQTKADLAQARRLQAQADRRAERERVRRIRAEKRAGVSPSPEPDDDNSPDNGSSEPNLAVEREKAQRLMYQKAYSDPKFRSVVESDPTLKHLIETNPLALVKDPVDAEDAVFQLEDLLQERIDTTPTPAAKPSAPTLPVSEPEKAPEFKAGAPNPAAPTQPSYKQHLDAGRIEDAVADKINDPGAWKVPGQPR